MKRSHAALAAAAHWAKRSKGNGETKGNGESIEAAIVVEDEPVETELSEKDTSNPSHGVWLLYNPSVEDTRANEGTVKIEDLVGSADLQETFQFNFNVEVDFFLQYLHPDARTRPVTFVTGSQILNNPPANIKEVVADLPRRFASHHSKMMVNFYPDLVEVVIMTCNLTPLDFAGLTQMCWRSGRLNKGKTSGYGSRMHRSLRQYLMRYHKTAISRLAQRLDEYDFSSVSVELLASVPSRNTPGSDEVYGYARLHQLLGRNDLHLGVDDADSTHNVVAQVTSIASPYVHKNQLPASVFSHLLCPTMFSSVSNLAPGGQSFRQHQVKYNYKPHLVFPTLDDVTSSTFGLALGSAVHFKYTGLAPAQSQYQQNIQPYLYRWNLGPTGREAVTPHTKIYACDNADNWRTLRWVLVGSHNLSKQAWGGRLVGGKYDVDSYELSVFVRGPLTPRFGPTTNPNEIRLPFRLPPTRYVDSDTPWSLDAAEQSGAVDRWGNTLGAR